MNTKNNLNDELKALSKMQIYLEQQGGPEKNGEMGELFEQILEIEDNILDQLGLPTNHPFYVELLRFDTPPTDYEISNRIKQLHECATAYLNRDVKTDIEILKEAQSIQLDAMYVLPELAIETHTYTIFVYDEILLKEQDAIENVLHELKTVNQYILLDTIGKLGAGCLTDTNEIIELLEYFGLKYIRQFYFSKSGCGQEGV